MCSFTSSPTYAETNLTSTIYGMSKNLSHEVSQGSVSVELDIRVKVCELIRLTHNPHRLKTNFFLAM
jgi:hypothetical protein